jgi:hypothetical protein
MSGASEHHETPRDAREGSEPVRYPEQQVLAVLDNGQRVEAATSALTSGGFLPSEVTFGTGAELADVVDASPGRGGLAGLLIRLAERVGITDEEMEMKNRYERALRDNRFVVAVSAPTDERKEEAARILREHGAHTMAYFGKYTIEYLVPPAGR